MMASTSDTVIPPARGKSGLVGSVLVRIIVPAWVLAGAAVKFWTFNPALLPEPILDLVRSTAGPLGISNLGWWLEMWLRFFIGAEFAAVMIMFTSPRLARMVASFLLIVFLTVLAATMMKSAARDGISAIWSGSCGCFGSASPPPIAMFLIDAAMLAGVVLLKPLATPGVGLRPIPVALSIILGFGVAFGRPTPVITLEPTPATTPTRTSPLEPIDATGWGDLPTTLEPFYFTEFSEWVGTPLSSQPIARLISRPLPDWVDQDRFHLVFHRADCEHCHALLENFFSGPLSTPVVAVEIPDGDSDAALGMPCEECLLHQLPAEAQYVLTTPVLLTVQDGTVIAVCEDTDDHDRVADTIAASR